LKTLKVIFSLVFLAGGIQVSHAELGFSQRTALRKTSSAKSNSDIDKAKRALRKLQKSNKCSRMAKSHAKTLAKKQFRVGVGKSHFGFAKRVQQYKIPGRVAEINANTKSGRFESALRAWLNSPTHRKQLLSKRNKKVGVSRAKSKNGKYYWVMCLEQKG